MDRHQSGCVLTKWRFIIMVQPKIALGMERRSDPDLLAYGGAVVAALKDNASFPAPWGDSTPSWEQLDAAYQAYRDAYHAALTHDTQKIAARNAARQAFTEMLRRVAAYVEFQANGSVAMLVSTGFALRQEQARSSSGAVPPGPMAELRGVATEHGGRIELRAGRSERAVAYEVQTAFTDPASTNGSTVWSHAQTVFSVQRVALEGLAPGFVWVRMRGANHNGYGPWTGPVRVLVV
jgi:hypothetical protein